MEPTLGSQRFRANEVVRETASLEAGETAMQKDHLPRCTDNPLVFSRVMVLPNWNQHRCVVVSYTSKAFQLGPDTSTEQRESQ